MLEFLYGTLFGVAVVVIGIVIGVHWAGRESRELHEIDAERG